MKKRTACFTSLTALGILAVDQISKYLIRSCLPVSSTYMIGASKIGLIHVSNPGIAFGVSMPLALVALLSLLLIIGLAWLLASRLTKMQPPTAYGLAACIGGAAGNLIDRISQGQVTDFIAIGIWPVFNLADIAIVIGTLVSAAGILSGREWRDGEADRDG